MDFSLENFSMMDFNYFDVTIASIILILGIKGFMQGFIKEAFGLLGLVAGVYFASRLADTAAAFIDTGKTFGTSPFTNVDASLMTSIGFGARFYTALSSEAQVIHLDVIKPLSSDLNVNNVEFRITTKHSF